MALDLQTKLQQAKLKIFGLNPTNDNDSMPPGAIIKKQHMFDTDFYDTTTNDLNETDLFGKDKLISYENMFKQNVRDAQMLRMDTNNLRQPPSADYYTSEANSKLPGITNMNDFKANYLTQDIAARKIQNAFRQHLIRKRQRLSMQTKANFKQKNYKTSSLAPNNNNNNSSTTKQTTIIFAKNTTTTTNVDNYNFINIYKKRVTTENFNLLSKSKQKLAAVTAVAPAAAAASSTTSSNKNANTENYSTQEFHTNRNSSSTQQQKAQNSSSSSSSSSSLTSSITSEAPLQSLSHSSSSTSNPKQVSSKKKSSSMHSIKKSKESLKLDVYENENEETMSLGGGDSSSSTSSLSSSGSSSSSASLATKPKVDNSEQQFRSASHQIITHKQLVSSSLNNIHMMENENRKRPLAIGNINSNNNNNNNAGELRYTPAALEQLFNAGLNHLDVLNLSALQLEELDKMRCIGVAQQETVALAHLIKSQKNNEVAALMEQQQQQQQQQNNASTNVTLNKILASKIAETKTKDAAAAMAAYELSTSSYNLKNKRQKQQLIDEMQKLKKRHQASSGSNSNSSTSSSSPDSTETNEITKQDKDNHHHHHHKKLSLNTDDEMNDELEKSFRQLLPSESHLKRSKQETNKDALDMSSFLAGPDTSMQQLQSHLQQSHQSNARFFEDDSFKKFTGEIVKKYMQEEELRSKHQAHLLKLREKALIEKTDAELAWLEQMKKKAQDKGEDEKMPSILSKQKGIMQKVRILFHL